MHLPSSAGVHHFSAKAAWYFVGRTHASSVTAAVASSEAESAAVTIELAPNETAAPYLPALAHVAPLSIAVFPFPDESAEVMHQAGSAHSELTTKVHDGARAQSLLEDEAKNKTLSFVGLAAGLVSAGIATALFAF